MNGHAGPEKTLCSLSPLLLPRASTGRRSQAHPTGRRSQAHPTTKERQSLTQCRDLSQNGEAFLQPLGKTGRKILYHNRLDLSAALPAPGLFEAGGGRCASISFHLLVASQHAQAHQQGSLAICVAKCWQLVITGQGHSAAGFAQECRRPEQGPPAHPTTTRLDGDDDWDNSPNHRQDHWNERQEPVNNSSSYQDSGAWRWDNERQDHYSDESYCHSEWANAAARLRRWRQNDSWDNSEWTTSWQDERQHGWQGHQRWYENDNERDDSNHANDYHQPNSNRWRHEDPETQDSNNSDRWHQEYQNNSAYHRWRQAGTGDGYWESNSGTQRHPESTHQDDSWQSTQWWQNGHHRGWWDSSAQ